MKEIELKKGKPFTWLTFFGFYNDQVFKTKGAPCPGYMVFT